MHALLVGFRANLQHKSPWDDVYLAIEWNFDYIELLLSET